MKPLLNTCGIGALGFAFALTCGPAHAAGPTPAVAPIPAAAPAHASVPRVDVAVAGSFPNAKVVGARVAGWLKGQGIPTETEIGPEPSATWVLASTQTLGIRLWITLSSPTSARLFFTVQERTDLPPRFLVQDVELRSGVDELGIERLAQVANFSAVAAWDGSAESSRQEVEQGLGVKATAAAATPTPTRTAPKSEPPPSAPPVLARKPYWAFVSGFAYEARAHGDEGTFLGVRPQVGAGWIRGQNEFSAKVSLGAGIVPYSIRKDGAKLDPSSLSWGFVLGATRRVSRDFWVGTELEYSLELISHRMPFNNLWRDLPTNTLGFMSRLGGGVGLGWDFPALKIGVFAVVSVPLANPDYVVLNQETGERHTLLSPWRAQPGFSFRTVF